MRAPVFGPVPRRPSRRSGAWTQIYRRRARRAARRGRARHPRSAVGRARPRRWPPARTAPRRAPRSLRGFGPSINQSSVSRQSVTSHQSVTTVDIHQSPPSEAPHRRTCSAAAGPPSPTGRGPSGRACPAASWGATAGWRTCRYRSRPMGEAGRGGGRAQLDERRAFFRTWDASQHWQYSRMRGLIIS